MGDIFIDKMRIISNIYISIFLLSIVLFGQYSLAEPNNSDYIIAKKSFQDGFYEIACASLEKFINENPGDPSIMDARLLLGEGLVHINRFNDAVKQFDMVLASEDKSDNKAGALYWKAEVYFRSRDFDKAKELYSSIISIYPTHSYTELAKYSIAWSLFEQEKYKESLDEFNKFLSSYPASNLLGQVVLKTGEILYRLKQYEESNKVLLKFVSENKDEAKLKKAYFYIAENYYYTGDYKASGINYEKAIALSKDPTVDTFAIYGKAWSYLKEGQYELSFNEFGKLENLEEFGAIADSAVFGKGEALYKMNKFSEAQALYHDLIEKYPNSKWLPNAYLALAESLCQINSYKEALEVLEKAIKVFPSGDHTDDIRYNLGWAYFKLEKYDEAVDEFTKVIKESRSDFYRVSAYCRLGDIYAQMNQPEKALDAYDIVLKEANLNPDAIFGYVDYAQYQIGRLLFKLEKYQGSILAFQSLLKNYPASKNAEDAKFGLAVAYFKNGNYESAREELKDFLTKYSNSSYKEKAMFQLASSCYNLFDYKQALEVFKDISLLGPGSEYHKRALYEAAWCYYKMGETEKAIVKLNEFITGFPEDGLSQDARFWLGEYYAGIKNYKEAELYFNSIIDRNTMPHLADEALYRLAIIYYDKKERDKSLQLLKKVKEDFPDSQIVPKAELKIVEILIEEESYRDSKDILNKFMANYKDTPYEKIASKYLGDIESKEGNIKEAIDYYKKAIDNTRGDFNASLQQEIGKLYEKLGDSGNAVTEYLKVGYLYPDSTNLVVSSQMLAAKLLEKEKKWAEAEKLYEKLVSMDVKESKFAQGRLEWIKANK